MAAAALGTTLRIRRLLSAPRERVFAAWTDPEQFRKWFVPPLGSAPSAEVDARVGGGFRVAMKTGLPGGTGYAVGSYVEVKPPERLVFALAWEGLPFRTGETLVTVEFHDRDGRTELVLTHERNPTRLAREFHSVGWRNSLRNLSRALANT